MKCVIMWLWGWGCTKWVRVAQGDIWVGLPLDRNLRFLSRRASVCFGVVANRWHAVTAFQATLKACNAESLFFPIWFETLSAHWHWPFLIATFWHVLSAEWLGDFSNFQTQQHKENLLLLPREEKEFRGWEVGKKPKLHTTITITTAITTTAIKHTKSKRLQSQFCFVFSSEKVSINS